MITLPDPDSCTAPPPSYLCPVCEDQGWAFVDGVAGAGPTVAACLCTAGEQRRAVVRNGKRARSLADVWPPEQVAAAFPDGTAAYAAKAASDRLAATGLPPVCREWTMTTFADIVVRNDRDYARWTHYGQAWIDTATEERSDVVLFGGKGTGKTGLAVAMARGAFDKGSSIRFITARDLLLTFRESMREDGEGERAIDAQFTAPDVLVLDEFGGTTLTDYARHTLTALVDQRQKSKRSTLITLNVEDSLTMGDVQAQANEILGARLADRLVDTAVWWAMTGRSRRKPRTKIQIRGEANRG